MPVVGLGVRKRFVWACGPAEMTRPREVLAHGEQWRPYRTTAS